MNAEQAHHFTFKTLKLAFRIPGVASLVNVFFGSIKGHEKQVMGLNFKNPVGLAAGLTRMPSSTMSWPVSVLALLK